MSATAEPVFAGVNHICIVTGDVDRSVRVWADRYGIGPWTVHTVEPADLAAEVEGVPVELGIRVGFARFASGARIELIQPLDDRGPYARSLTQHGGADHLHHLRLDVADFDASVERLAGLGLGETLSAGFAGAEGAGVARARYFATEPDLGFTAEVAEVTPGFRLAEPDYVYPPPVAGEDD